MKPLGIRILVVPDPQQTETATGLIIPAVAIEKRSTGVIKATGPGTEREKMTLKKGQRVLYSKEMAEEFTVDGQLITILSQANVIAIL